jgi:hypothetical protein
MAITNSLQRILDRKQWEFCTPAPNVNIAGSFINSSTLFDQLQFYCSAAGAQYIYNPAEDAWVTLPTGGLAAVAAGTAGTFHPYGPNGVAAAGTSSSITLNSTTTIPGSLAGYTIRITSGTGAGQERTIASNTYGTSSVVTVTTPWTVTPDATSNYLLLTGRWYIWAASSATAQFKYYDVATNSWSVNLALPSGITTFGTDAKLRSTYGGGPFMAAGASAGGFIFANGTATGVQSSTTLQNTTKSWTVNQWANYQVRIVGGTGAGQIRIIASNTGNTLTVPTWTTTPDATSVYVIEGCDDYIYLTGNNALTIYRYTITGASWSTLTPVSARGGSPNVGMSLQWVTNETNSAWANESSIINGRRLYSFRGSSSSTLDYYDIPGNTWVSGVTYLRQGEVFGTGTSWDNGHNGNMYVQKDTTSRFLRYSASRQTMEPIGQLLYPQGTGVVGDRMFTVTFTSGTDTLTYLYHMRNSQTELFRCLLF